MADTNQHVDEEAVRKYCIFVDNPRKLVDREGMRAARQAARATKDPLAKLKAFSAHERAAQPDEDALRKGFVANAKQWADMNGITVGAFQDLKVPDDVLRDAGFSVAPRKAQQPAVPRRTVARQTIVDYVMKEAPDEFTAAMVMKAVGSANSTTHQVLAALVREGVIEKVGVRVDSTTATPPAVYRRVATPAATAEPKVLVNSALPAT